MTGLTPEQLWTVLSYNPDTGEFTWRGGHPGKGTTAGKMAGYVKSDGYRRIRVFYRQYHASVLAYLYMTGKWPTNQIDHRDLNRSNDRWDNLRPATRQENGANRSSSRPGRLKGVQQRGARWEARIRVNRKYHYLGSFNTEADAHAAYCAAATAFFGEFARSA